MQDGVIHSDKDALYMINYLNKVKLWALLVRTRMGQFSLTPLLAVSLSYLYGLGHRHSSSEIGKSLSCQR